MKQIKINHIAFFSILLLMILLSYYSGMEQGSDDLDSVQDLRMRTAIYEAGSRVIDKSDLSIKVTDSGTYAIEGLSAFDVGIFEEKLTTELKERGFSFDVELGLFKVADDSLVYGSVLSMNPKKLQAGFVNTEDVNMLIHVVRETSMGDVNPSHWLLIFILLVALLLSPFAFRSLNYPKTSFTPDVVQTDSSLHVGPFQYDPVRSELIHPEFSCKLTHKEGKLLDVFFSRPNQVISRQEILKQVWEDDGFYVARSMDVFISKLRKHLAMEPQLKIESIRGIGYILRY